MTHENNISPESWSPEHLEIKALTDTVLLGFELVEKLETSKHQPDIQQLERTVSGPLLHETDLRTLMPASTNSLSSSEAEIQITYNFVSLGARPSLTIRLDRISGEIDEITEPYATIYRSGESLNETNFQGNTASLQTAADEHYFVKPDDAALFLESLLRLDDGLHINDQGVAVLDLLQELVHDPQYPPMARFIADTLQERGAGTNDSATYSLKFDDTNYILRVINEDGKTVELSIEEVLVHDVEVLGSDIRTTYEAIGATISRTKLTHAISFYTVDAEGIQHPLEEEKSGELIDLRRRIQVIMDHLSEERL